MADLTGKEGPSLPEKVIADPIARQLLKEDIEFAIRTATEAMGETSDGLKEAPAEIIFGPIDWEGIWTQAEERRG